MKSFKRRQIQGAGDRFTKALGRDKLERNQHETVRRKGGNMWGRQTNALGRKPSEGRR